MNCLLVINTLSGNASKVCEKDVIEKLAPDDNVTTHYIRDLGDEYDVKDVDKLIVCGGDGTLNNAINLCKDKDIDIYYLPFGTFNETAKNAKRSDSVSLARIGSIGDAHFAYVAAAGSFTDIVRDPNAKTKRRLKVFAYFSKVLSRYRVHRIHATVSCDKFTAEDDYTLIMLSNARRCFGFRFNRLYRDNSDELQLITVNAPKMNNLLGKIRMFFPFFRIFFIGFGKEYIGKYIRFVSVKKASLTLRDETHFCVDGEYRPFSHELNIEKITCRARVHIVPSL